MLECLWLSATAYPCAPPHQTAWPAPPAMKPLRVLASPCHPQSLALNSVMLVVHQSPLPSPSSSWASGLISDTGLGDCSSPPHQITSPALPRARGQQVQNQIDMPMGVTH